MTIGIDIDNTLVNTDLCVYNTLKKQNVLKNIDINNLTANDITMYQDYIEDIILNDPFYENAIDVVNYFKTKNIKIIIITARNNKYSDKMDDLTINFLKNNGLVYDKIIFDQSSKLEACKNNMVDLFIDDTEEVLDEIKAYGIKTIRFGKKENLSNHLIIDNWLDIKKYVDNLWGDKHE